MPNAAGEGVSAANSLRKLSAPAKKPEAIPKPQTLGNINTAIVGQCPVAGEYVFQGGEFVGDKKKIKYAGCIRVASDGNVSGNLVETAKSKSKTYIFRSSISGQGAQMKLGDAEHNKEGCPVGDKVWVNGQIRLNGREMTLTWTHKKWTACTETFQCSKK